MHPAAALYLDLHDEEAGDRPRRRSLARMAFAVVAVLLYVLATPMLTAAVASGKSSDPGVAAKASNSGSGGHDDGDDDSGPGGRGDDDTDDDSHDTGARDATTSHQRGTTRGARGRDGDTRTGRERAGHVTTNDTSASATSGRAATTRTATDTRSPRRR